jgi:hypothetical protein
MFGDLPPSSSVTGIRFWLAYCMIRRPVVGLAGEGDLGDALARCQRLAGLQAEAVDDVEHARRQQVADELHQHQDRGRRLLGRLEHHAVAGGQRGRQLPHGHQDREIPRDDLADDAQRLVEVIGDGVVVDLADRAFLRADAAGEIAEVVDRRAACRRPSSRGSACRCRWSRPAPAARGSAPCGRRSCSGCSRARSARSCPRLPWRHGRHRARSSMSSAVERATSQKTWPVIGVTLSKYSPLLGATNWPPM